MNAVSSIADALSQAFGIAKPMVDDATAQKYEKAFQNRISQIQGILSAPDSDSRAHDISSATNQLLNDAGYPSTESGVQDVIRIPLAHFLSLYSATAAKIKDDALLAKFTQKITSI